MEEGGSRSSKVATYVSVLIGSYLEHFESTDHFKNIGPMITS